MGLNPFELPETYGNPYGLLGRAALELMGLKPHHGPQNNGDKSSSHVRAVAWLTRIEAPRKE